MATALVTIVAILSIESVAVALWVLIRSTRAN